MAYQPKKYSSDFYRDQMMNLIQSRSAGVLKEKKKMERMQDEAEKEQSGKWGDAAMLGASLGGMAGMALGNPVLGMGIGAGAGALLGVGRGIAGGAGPMDYLKGAVPTSVGAAAGMSSMAQTLAAQRGYGPNYLPQGGGGGSSIARDIARSQALRPYALNAGTAPPLQPPPGLGIAPSARPVMSY